ncbi:hypothetical protein [Streptococcus dentiloxodontae]
MTKNKRKTRSPEPQKAFLSPEMRSLLEEAYQLFSYNLKGQLSLCTCPVCITEENVRRLISTPVREISRELIFEYLEAVNNDEEGYQIKHFLPRILELCAGYEYIRVDDSLNLERCHFEKDIWRAEELDFMKRFSVRFMIDAINADSEIKDIDSPAVYLVMFDLAGLETKQLLDLDLWLEKSDKVKAMWSLEDLFCYFTKDYAQFHYSFSVNPAFNRQMTAWLSSRELAQAFLPVIEEYLLTEENLDAEEEQRLEQLYRVFEARLNAH